MVDTGVRHVNLWERRSVLAERAKRMGMINMSGQGTPDRELV